ncbi:MAG TPA: iron-sulfur cluster co-chaperone HscB C-terminal domain-containing protein [Panacibacter sp.]|nr:iron-sulfur cluster co-chaperone HscB C-terminal domain-containing protein [Panacibacter sp.]
MDYFQLFNIPVALKIDKAGLAKQYFELQKKYHPDFFAQAGKEEQDDVLEISSAVNKAFKIFQNADETIKYVLLQKGLLQEEEKYILPPGFLMDMMDLNEQLMDAKLEGDKAKIADISGQLSSRQNEIYAPVKEIIENYNDSISTEKELLQVKEYYYKKKYLNRILAGLN